MNEKKQHELTRKAAKSVTRHTRRQRFIVFEPFVWEAVLRALERWKVDQRDAAGRLKCLGRGMGYVVYLALRDQDAELRRKYENLQELTGEVIP